MLSFTKTKDQCTGCSACYAACPVCCIEMKPDEEGFLYPVASEACIHCGKCQQVCPIQNVTRPQPDVEQRAYAAVSRDADTWRKSASGGAFSEICRAWADDDTLIAGAIWDGELRVHHVCVNGADQIAPLRKSKYIASDLEDVFCQLREHLRQGKKALFCGTPCQVAGLRAYLGKNYDNLLLLDLICHGVGSPEVFSYCIDAIGRQLNIHVGTYEFRAKRNIHETDYMAKVTSANAKKSVYLQKDPYTQLFLSQLTLRPSCSGHCQFHHPYRQGDLTIADFKGLSKVFPQLTGAKRNYSTIVINSAKGASMIPILERTMTMLPCTLEDISIHNPLFSRQVKSCENRDVFFADFVLSPENAIRKWTKPGQLCRRTAKRMIQEILPEPLHRAVLCFIQKARKR